MSTARKVRTGIEIVIALVLIYVAAAMAAYAFRHPEQTETQRLGHFWDAMLLR